MCLYHDIHSKTKVIYFEQGGFRRTGVGLSQGGFVCTRDERTVAARCHASYNSY